MGRETRVRLRLAFQLYSCNQWTAEAATAVLAKIAATNPYVFLTSCDAARREAAHAFKKFDFSALDPESRAPASESQSAPVDPLLADTPVPVVAPLEPTQAPVTPSKTTASRGKKTAAKQPRQAPKAPSGKSKPQEEELSSLTSVWLEEFDPSAQYLLSRALIQATGFNEAKVNTMLNGRLPVVVDSFCQSLHATSLRKALVRVRGTKVSIGESPNQTKEQ